VAKLALPSVGEQVLNTAVGLADVFLVGHLSLQAASQLGYSSATALAATGLANNFVWLMTVLFIALAIGSTALIARATGAGDVVQQQGILRQSMLLGLAIGLLATLLSWVTARPFLLLINAPPDVLPLGEQFIHTVAWSFVPASLLFIGTACLRGVGDTRTPLYVMLGVNGINILISWLLINGNMGAPILGVEGAAIGSAVARGSGGLLLVWLLWRGISGLKLAGSTERDAGAEREAGVEASSRPTLVDPETLRRIVRIGLPSAGEQLVFQSALLIFVGFVTGLGTVAYAAHNVTITIESLSFLPGLGYAAASSALVGQALGAKAPQQAEAYAYESLWQGGLMMSLLGLLMVCFPQQIVALFVNDPAVVEMAAQPLRAAGLIQPALAVSFILLGALRGAGDTKWPLYSRIITTWGLRLPLTLLLVGQLNLGLAGIWLAMCADFTAQALLALWRFSQNRWKRIKL
jgi:putative MATE family efflux protein